MDDGAVLLADRWVATDGDGPASAHRPGQVTVRQGRFHRTAVRAAAGRAGSAGGDPKRPWHVRLRGGVQPVRRARRRAGHAALAPGAAVARRPHRDGRAELSRPGAVGRRARRGRRPRGAGDPGQRLAVSRPDVRRRQPVAGNLGVVAGARRRAGAAAGSGGDRPCPAPAARRARRASDRGDRRARHRLGGRLVSRGGRPSGSRRLLLGQRATTPRGSRRCPHRCT